MLPVVTLLELMNQRNLTPLLHQWRNVRGHRLYPIYKTWNEHGWMVWIDRFEEPY